MQPKAVVAWCQRPAKKHSLLLTLACAAGLLLLAVAPTDFSATSSVQNHKGGILLLLGLPSPWLVVLLYANSAAMKLLRA